MPERLDFNVEVEKVGLALVIDDLPCECGTFAVIIGQVLVTVGDTERVTSKRVCASCARLRP